MFCCGCCYPDTKEESGNQYQCSSREEINENPKSRSDTGTYGRYRFGTYELSSSDESLMDILIHGRNDSANISYPISLIIETQGKQDENMSAISGTCVNTPGEFCKINIKKLGLFNIVASFSHMNTIIPSMIQIFNWLKRAGL